MRKNVSLGVVPLIITLVLVSTQLPYLYAHTAAGEEHIFSGLLVNPIDGYSYLAKMNIGKQGYWTFALPYTAEVGRGSYLFVYYIFLGHIARVFSLPLQIVFHLSRLLSTIFMLWALRRFCIFSFSERRLQLASFAFSTLGSGIGWIAVLFGRITSDLWVAESYPFLSAYTNAHFPLSLGLMLFILSPARFVTNCIGIRRNLVIAGCTFMLALVSPFGVIITAIIYGLLVIYQLIHGIIRKYIGGDIIGYANNLGSVLVGGMLPLVYQYWVSSEDPLLAKWNMQNITPSPPIWDLMIAFSPAFFLAIIGVLSSNKVGNNHVQISIVWILSTAVMLAIPFSLQRRFLIGCFIPLSVLSIKGLTVLSRMNNDGSYHQKRFSWGLMLCFLMMIPTNIILLLSSIYAISTRDNAIYLSVKEDKALQWIQASTIPNSIFLAAPDTSLFIPAFSSGRVIYGHPFETVDADKEKGKVTNFFQELIDHGGVRINDLEYYLGHHVDYIFWGERERKFADADYQWLGSSGLELVYSNGEVAIYKIE